MNRWLVRGALWATTIVTLGGGAASALRLSSGAVVVSSPVRRITPLLQDSSELAAAADLATDGDLFDAGRGFEANPEQASPTVSPPSSPPKPILVLRGIVGGPPWNAILGGIPGQAGDLVMRRGERAGGITLRSIEPHAVVVQGMDTTWRLTIPR